jgi:tRNA(Ile)-lysidine synthase
MRLPNGSSFSAQPHEAGLAPGEYTLRLRQGGERSYPEQRAHSQTLKKLLQEMGVEPWLRNQLPLVYQGEQLVAVGDLWIERGFSVQQGVKLNWQFPAHLNGMENF